MSDTGSRVLFVTIETIQLTFPELAIMCIEAALGAFRTLWSEIEPLLKVGHHKLPAKIIWLNGAPGAGKGTHTEFILESQQITSEPIIISALLQSKEAKACIDAGIMAGDLEVLRILLRELLKSQYASGALVDGCPRTPVQAVFLWLLNAYLKDLYQHTPALEALTPPKFHIAVLYVTAEESVARQLKRGQETLNGCAQADARKTDLDANLAAKRYKVFQDQTYPSLQALEGLFPYHWIDAKGSIEHIRDLIRATFEV